MNRRQYVKRAGVLCGAVSLSGCGLLGGGSGTPTDDGGPATGTIDVSNGTPEPAGAATPDPTPVPRSEELGTAVQAKTTAIDTYGSGVEAFRTIDDADSYDFRGRELSENLDTLRSAVDALDSDRARETLSGVADYLHAAATALDTAEQGTAEATAVITDLAQTAILPTGGSYAATLESAQTTLSQALDTVDGPDRSGLTAVGNVLPQAELARLNTIHGDFIAQIDGLGNATDGIQMYLDGTSAYAAAGDHRVTAIEAGQDAPDERDRELQAAIEEYTAAESALSSGESTIAGADASLTGDLRTQLDRIECRSGAFAEASGHWQQFARLVLDGAPQSERDSARADATSAVQQCSQ
jgi:hypothetical protein